CVRRSLGGKWQQLGLQVLLLQASTGAKRVTGLAVSDPEDPGRGQRVAAKGVRLAPYHPEGVVDDFLGEIVTACKTRQEARHAAMVEVVEFLERLAIARGDARDEFHLACNTRSPAIGRLRHAVIVVTGRFQ